MPEIPLSGRTLLGTAEKAAAPRNLQITGVLQPGQNRCLPAKETVMFQTLKTLRDLFSFRCSCCSGRIGGCPDCPDCQNFLRSFQIHW